MVRNGNTAVTVAFELEALEALADSAAVYEETRTWAESVGILSDRPTYVITNYARTNGLDYAFHGGPRSVIDALGHLRMQPEHAADRYLLITRSERDADEVETQGWEQLSVASAADAADWELADAGRTDWP